MLAALATVLGVWSLKREGSCDESELRRAVSEAPNAIYREGPLPPEWMPFASANRNYFHPAFAGTADVATFGETVLIHFTDRQAAGTCVTIEAEGVDPEFTINLVVALDDQGRGVATFVIPDTPVVLLQCRGCDHRITVH